MSSVYDDDLPLDGGWAASAPAWIVGVEQDSARRFLDPLMLHLAGDVRAARVVDVGCGEGRFSRVLADRGARCIGIDPTRLLLNAARDRGAMAPVQAMAEAMPLRPGAFDLAVTYITLVDITGYREAIAEMARALRPGGRLLAANIGFVSASVETNGGWHRDESGNALYVPIDNYSTEWSRVYEWAGLRLRNWHRPLAAYMSAYLRAGLILRRFMEPVPPDSLRQHPDVERAFRVPWFTVMLWEKPRQAI
jgi:SAM-dependent methyltransferase